MQLIGLTKLSGSNPKGGDMEKKLLDYCTTDKQREVIKLYLEGVSEHKSAAKLGVTRSAVQSHKRIVIRRAAGQGYSPSHDMIHTAPSTHLVKGTSTLYSDDGQVKAQWVKTNLKQEDQIQSIKNALDEFLEDHKNKSPKIPKPKKKLKDQELAVVNIGDAHFGMLAHDDISGENYDCKIAADRHKQVFLRLMNNAPECDTVVINQLGDYYHADTYTGTTTKGTPLDTDGRLEHVFLIGLEVMSFIVEEALKRFNKVIVRHCRGNHDAITSMALKAQQQAYWRNNKRVTIEMSPAVCWVYQHGKTAFMVSHGDTIKHAKMAEYFAARYPEIWGASEHRYCWHGHIHSKQISRETYGQTITESFAGLPPSDAWHDSSGYVSGQSMCLLVLDKDKGEVRRSTERL